MRPTRTTRVLDALALAAAIVLALYLVSLIAYTWATLTCGCAA